MAITRWQNVLDKTNWFSGNSYTQYNVTQNYVAFNSGSTHKILKF